MWFVCVYVYRVCMCVLGVGIICFDSCVCLSRRSSCILIKKKPSSQEFFTVFFSFFGVFGREREKERLIITTQIVAEVAVEVSSRVLATLPTAGV